MIVEWVCIQALDLPHLQCEDIRIWIQKLGTGHHERLQWLFGSYWLDPLCSEQNHSGRKC